MTVDLKLARVFFSARGEKVREEAALQGLESAAGVIKKKLGRELRLRYMPELVFQLDRSFEYGSKIDRLIQTIQDEKEKDSQERSLRSSAGRGGFLIASHENPEGDAIGSILALGLALRQMGKKVTIFNPDPIPEVLAFLPGAGEIVRQVPENDRFDVALALDCGDRKRLGEEFSKVKKIGRLINVDHHASNTQFGDVNWIDPQASSAAEMVFDLLREIPVKLSSPVGENIYTGILTDTGSFHYSNTTRQDLCGGAQMRSRGGRAGEDFGKSL